MICSKKKETRQCSCGGDRKHFGYAPKTIVSVSGEFKTNRIYRRCSTCGITIHPTDEMLGLEDRYSVGLRDLAMFAAVDSSFDKAEKRLKKFCTTNLENREFLSRRSATIGSGLFRWSGSSYCQPRLWVFVNSMMGTNSKFPSNSNHASLVFKSIFRNG